MTGSDAGFDVFFAPRGVVLVGASHNPAKLGYGIARNLAGGGFEGPVYFVNPHGAGELFDRPVFPSVEDVPDPVEMAVILVPADAVPGVLEQCGARGISGAVVVSGGFRETGPAGVALEERCREVAVEHGIRLLGPNCIGVIDTHSGLNTTFLAPPGPERGDIAFISHSGAICAAVIDWSAGRGFGLSRLISLGNQADLDEVDALEMVAADPSTRVVTMYLETLTRGRRFVERAQSGSKPVVVLKVGRSAAGQAAVISHTGALAGHDEAFRAAFRRAGVIRAGTTEGLLDAARALAAAPLPTGRRMAVLTNAGGPGVTAADALVAAGLELAELGATTRKFLAEGLPPGAGLTNPIDMLASAGPEEFARCLRCLTAAPEVDGIVVVFPPPPMFPAEEIASALLPIVEQAAKPILVSVMGDRAVRRAVLRLQEAGVPDFRVPERAATAMAVLADRADFLSGPGEPSSRPDALDRAAAERILAGRPAGRLGLHESAELVNAYRIDTPAAAIISDPEHAVALAKQLEGPLALKLDSFEVVHKSDVNAVRLYLSTPDEIRTAFRDLVGSDPAGRVLVQQMVDTGHDVIVGGVRDPHFGPVVMFGSGGTEVEGLGDVEFALAPLTGADIRFLLSSTWAGRRLSGHRNAPPVDAPAVEAALTAVGWLLVDHPRIQELEINPLRVRGSGASALDVRVGLGSPS